MRKERFRYNPKTLSYEREDLSFVKRVLRLSLWLSPSIVLGLLFGLFFTSSMESPQERQLKADLKKYESEVIRMRSDIDLVNNVLDDIEKRDEDLYRMALYTDKFPEELRRMGAGGSDKYNYLRKLPNSKVLVNTASSIDALERRLHAQTLSFRELIQLAKDKEKMLACIPAIQPVRNTDLKRLASGYGYRIDPIYKTRRMHSGMDFTADIGTEVYATGDGVIELVERKRWGYGKQIIIDHGFGYKTRYAHLSAFKVRVGQKVKRGDLIGLVGSSGKSTGPHLHYEVLKNNKAVNPIGYYHSDLTPEQYEQLLEMSEKSYKALD